MAIASQFRSNDVPKHFASRLQDKARCEIPATAMAPTTSAFGTSRFAGPNKERLDYYYRAVKAIILSRQNPNSGLIPASVAVTTHGDYRDAWVR